MTNQLRSRYSGQANAWPSDAGILRHTRPFGLSPISARRWTRWCSEPPMPASRASSPSARSTGEQPAARSIWPSASTACSPRWAGIPTTASAAPDDVRGELERLAKAPKVVAIGEIGIDHYRLPSTRGGSAADDEAFKARQVTSLFQQQLEVAAKLGLNVVVHQRAAFEACVEVFEPFADRVRGVFHCFVNDPAAARRVIDLGSLVSFTGVCTFKNAARSTGNSWPRCRWTN